MTSKRFEGWVGDHKDRVYSLAYYSLANQEEAEDVTQEVLLRMWKNRNDINEATLGAWLTRVTRNACIDVVRRRKAFSSRIVVNGDAEQFINARSHEPGPDEIALSSEFGSQVERALSTIQEPYRSIIILREMQDLKYEQISETLELPLNTVKSYLHRGRRMLRERLNNPGAQ